MEQEEKKKRKDEKRNNREWDGDSKLVAVKLGTRVYEEGAFYSVGTMYGLRQRESPRQKSHMLFWIAERNTLSLFPPPRFAARFAGGEQLGDREMVASVYKEKTRNDSFGFPTV